MSITMSPLYLKFIQVIFMVSLLLQVDLVSTELRCKERERQALLHFKAGLVDDFGILSSWGSEYEKRDCCQWKGVRCSNLTGHILMLDLHGEGHNLFPLQSFLRGKIRKSLMELQHLKYLNLSWNHFEGSHIPDLFGSLSNLRYLDLSQSRFHGNIPSQFGHLSKLQYLDLSSNNLEGTIPSQLGNLSNLLNLDLGYNIALKIGDQNHAGGQWLSNLTSLTHLDLSWVTNLNNSHNWLQMIGKLPKLRELRLSSCSLSDHFVLSLSPSTFNISTSLAVFDLLGNTFTSRVIFQWVSNVSSNLVELNLGYNNLLEGPISYDFGSAMMSLKRLYLYGNSLKGGVLKFLMNICTLRSLFLYDNNLTEDLPTILHNFSGCARYSLQEFNLRDNQIIGTLPDLSIFPSLKTLDLSNNRLSQLESLSIQSNSSEGGIPKSFWNTCTLCSLDLSNNSLSEELALIIHHLSGCARYSLQELYLYRNQINGILPDLSTFSTLKVLDLFENRVNGKIPENNQFPSQLETFDMSSNSLEGVITDSHFVNMSKLKSLDLSDNSLALTFSQNWVPSFQLNYLGLRSCKLGPAFPKWLQTQNNLTRLDISNAGILDIVPEWFWALSTKLVSMDISYNNFTGTIPNLPLRLIEYSTITLTSNQFEGPVPSFLRSAISLHLSKNKFSNTTLFLCANSTVETLGFLDLSNNQISGQIPDCLSHFKSLAYLDLSNNNFSGQVPTSVGSALELQALILRNNSLNGELPISLWNCTKLVMLDVGENRLSGSIPSWIGSRLQQLQMLSLRRNHFLGSLPSPLCSLTSIQLLDISSNNLSGQIPKCFNNFSSMTQERSSIHAFFRAYEFNLTDEVATTESYNLTALLTWKGAERTFENNKLLLKSIDLSSNQLSGEIPIEVEDLVELISLNLSRNNLTGKIPSKIGRLKSLEFLDLSRNQLFGSIPSSLAQIDRLTMLDLSHNHLFGEIPIGTQLQSFNASSYEENQGLCGKPLEKMCSENEPAQESTVKPQEDKDSLSCLTFYMSIALGFITGFWGFFGSILFIRSWRHTYFRFLNNLSDSIYVRVFQ